MRKGFLSADNEGRVADEKGRAHRIILLAILKILRVAGSRHGLAWLS